MAPLFHLAARNLRRNKRRSALTALTIVVGVALVIFAWGLMSALLGTMVDDVVSRRLGALLVRPRVPADVVDVAPLEPSLDLSGPLPSVVAQTPGVAAFAPRFRFAGLLSNGRTQSMVMVTAIDVEAELKVCPRRAEEVQGGSGSYLHAGSAQGAVLGAELAKGLMAQAASTLTLQAAGKNGTMNALDVEVAGTSRGASFLEGKAMVTVPYAFAENLLRMPQRATELAVAIKPGADIKDVRAALLARLPGDVEVVGWQEQVPFLRDAQYRMRAILGGVGFVLFAIAIFGVVNTMLMSVWERVREIGTLLALGLRRRQITQLFLLEGVFLGVLGGAAGVALGVGGATLAGIVGISLTPPGAEVAFVLRPTPSLPLAAAAFVLAVLGALLASALPARRAAQLDPVEALRR